MLLSGQLFLPSLLRRAWKPQLYSSSTLSLAGWGVYRCPCVCVCVGGGLFTWHDLCESYTHTMHIYARHCCVKIFSSIRREGLLYGSTLHLSHSTRAALRLSYTQLVKTLHKAVSIVSISVSEVDLEFFGPKPSMEMPECCRVVHIDPAADSCRLATDPHQ